ncbi:MAG: filamentous hemagglutinin N-terminal domain-containing protein, partial [Nostoc sp.]|uniref:two-partner secretion domain-containing protein n=1 Tax=Nostoc sp. TaxID=1180 RepID=UPI002FFB9270
MIVKSWFGRGWEWKIGGWVSLVAALSIGLSENVLAQIVPDNTLGVESSVVKPNVNIQGILSDRIDGGATRGANLFHSFREFNIGEGRGAYFANPTGIENILTRVTGGNPSNILGRLGVLGGANLFLLNPNGIIFGANASLDIKGSFVATTADRVQLGDSGYFSAAQPQTSSLLSVTPGALFFSQVANQPTAIINQGNLSTGKHLTLSAGNLDLQGQLQAGGDLTLLAQDTVKVRDSAIPFIASAGRNLLVQGNLGVDIFALSHPESGLFSGGDMVLRSSKTVEGDAHYWSGGNFRIEQLDGSLGDLSSPHDPIFRARGDVFINTYKGTSLHILAGGKVEIPGYVWIQGADPENGLVERVNLADGTTVSINGKSEPTLDIRAGVNPDVIGEQILTVTGTGNFIQPAYATSNQSNADIKIGTILFANAASQPLAGRLLLTNQYQPNSSLSGDIQVTQTLEEGWGAIFMDGGAGNPSVVINSRGGITLDGTVKTSSSSGDDGGAISLVASNGSINTGKLNSSSLSSGTGIIGNGGAISLVASNGSITTGDLNSTSDSTSGSTSDLDFPNESLGDGGAISISASNDIKLDGTVKTSSNSGDGGAITLNASNGIINIKDLDSSWRPGYKGLGKGGAISITASNGSINTGNLDSYSFSYYPPCIGGGAISITASNGSINTGNLYSYSFSSGITGNGGAISLVASNGSINTGDLSSSTYSRLGDAGNGGDISLVATNDSINTGSLYSDSFSAYGGGNEKGKYGGNISLVATKDINITGNLDSSSFSGISSSGNGGNISFSTSNGSINTGNLDSDSFSRSGSAEDGGNINLVATNGSINTGNLDSDSYSWESNAKNGGNINLIATKGINITGDLKSSSSSVSGNAANGGEISLIARGGDIIGNSPNSLLASFSLSEEGTAGRGGKVTLEAQNNITNLEILTLSSFSEAGNAAITGFGNLSVTNTRILTSKQVEVKVPSLGTVILDVGRQGQSGNVTVTSLGDLTFNDSSIESDTKGIDNAGNVLITSPGLVTLNNSQIISNTSNSGDAGNIDIKAGQGITFQGLYSYQGTPQPGALFAGTTNFGAAGKITLTTPELTLQNGAEIATTTNNLGAAGNITLKSHPNKENLTINVEQDTSISASTSNVGTGGNLIIMAPNALTIQGQGILSTETAGAGKAGNIELTSRNLDIQQTKLSTSTTGTGNAGDITLNASTLTVAKEAKVFAFTDGSGDSGTIKINAPTVVNLGIGVENFSPVLSVETRNAGKAGNIIINTPTLTLSDTARITATATASATNTEGDGSITLNASNMHLAGVVGVFAETEGQTPAGRLTLKPYQDQSTLNLTLAPQSRVSASTSGSGKGGNLIVTAPEAVTISGAGLLTVETTGDGAAGNLTIDTQQLTISDGATVSASTSSTNPNGVGGNITVDATESLDLSNKARLLAESNGAAPSGNVTINTGNLTARNGTIATSSEQSSGGGITITADKIRLFGDSDITTNVNQGAGGGGNINLKADSILAFDDSDILAFARDGKGGDITLDTRAFFGENYRPAPRNTDPGRLDLDRNNRVDINATGAVSGIITIPDVSFIQNSLTELPENQINTESILANSCIVRRNQPTRGT